MKVRPHKIGSVTSRLKLGPEVEFVRLVEPRVGQVLVVKALEEKRVYDVVELPSGRTAHVSMGDIVIGALGRRDALRGFVGRVPEKVRAGDVLHILNLGGVLGEAIGGSKEVGAPLRVEVLGMAVGKDGKGLNIADAAITEPAADAQSPPVIVVSGTCMSSGKTQAACEIISRLTARGYAAAGVKLTGVAALKDTLNMADHGAVATLSFLDCGLPSTAGVEDVAPVARRILRSIERESGVELDVVVAEVGDGIIGAYGVDSILRDPEFRSLVKAHVLCATDLVAAWGGIRWLEGIDLAVNVVAGPATDNQVGIRYIEGELGIPAANARVDPERFVNLVEEAAFTGAA